MATHEINHNFVSDGRLVLVHVTLADGRIAELYFKLFNDDGTSATEIIDLTPQELVDIAATINQAAEWVMALSLREENGTDNGDPEIDRGPEQRQDNGPTVEELRAQ